MCYRASLVAQLVKNPPAMRETWVQSLGWEDPLEKGKATHSSILAWRIPWTEEPGALQSLGLQGVGHDWECFTSPCAGGSVVKNLPTMQETQVQSLSCKDPLEKGMATHSSILAWRIPWTEEPGGLQFMGSQRVQKDINWDIRNINWEGDKRIEFFFNMQTRFSYFPLKMHC